FHIVSIRIHKQIDTLSTQLGTLAIGAGKYARAEQLTKLDSSASYTSSCAREQKGFTFAYADTVPERIEHSSIGNDERGRLIQRNLVRNSYDTRFLYGNPLSRGTVADIGANSVADLKAADG